MPKTDRTTTTIRLGLLSALGAAIALISLAGVTASAQNGASPAQLRRENDRLRERITELEAALDESQRRIDRLEQQIATDAETPNPDAGQPSTPTPTPTDEQPSPAQRRVPATPSACPDALFESLVDSYNETFPGIAIPAFSEVQNWIRRVGRERQRTEWLVRVHDTKVDQGHKSSVSVNIIDPHNGEDICNNFSIQIGYKDAMRIRDATDVALWSFEGTLTVNLSADRSRPEFNREDSPKTVGPYAVFGWSFDVDQITPAANIPEQDSPEPPKPQER